MDKTHSSGVESPYLSLEQEILRSLSILLKNVSEFFTDVPYLSSVNTTDESFSLFGVYPSTTTENIFQNATATFLTYTAATLLLWTFNYSVTKSRFLAAFLEVLLTWTVIVVFFPLIFLIIFPIFIVRVGLSIYLRLRYGTQVFLCNPFDAVWSFERPASASTCVGLYVIEGEADLKKIRKLLYERTMLRNVNGELVYDRFRWALKNICGFMSWRRLDHFELNYHLKLFPGQTGSWSEADLFQALANKHDESLCIDENRSPWEILVVPNFLYSCAENGKTYYAIAFRLHHSLMDGISMGHILHDCIADRPFKFSVDPIAPLKTSKFTIWFAYLVSFVLLPRITIKNLCFFEKNAFHGETLTGPKEMCWSRPIKLIGLKEMKNVAKCSVFAVLLSSLGGAMRKMYERKGHPVPSVINACPAVAILPYNDRRPRNRFSVVLYKMEIGRDCILERLKQIFQASKKLAASPDVISNYYIVYVLGLLPFAALKRLAPLAHATMTFSNIPGPSERVTVFQGDKLVELGAWIPIKNRIGIGMALFSYEDRVRVTFIGDRSSLPSAGDVHSLCEEFEQEITLLADRLGYNGLFIS